MTDVPLSTLTTMQVGGPARELITATTREQLIEAALDTWDSNEPWLILGGGSNTIVADEGFDGTVIHVQTTGIERQQDISRSPNHSIIRVAAGENWDSLVAWSVEQGLAGIEALSGIPGFCGAAPIQNIGAYGHEVSEFITRVRTYDRQAKGLKTFTNSECDFSYRNSHFKAHPGRYVVLDVQFNLRKGEMTTAITYAELAKKLGVEVGEKAPIEATRKAVLELRGAKGMLLNTNDRDSWSAGSFFTNPIVSQEIAAKLPEGAPQWPTADGMVKTSAAWLIENSGVHKGDSHGGARVSTKHVLALTNAGNATATDIAELAKSAQSAVFEKFGITLEPEVNLVGLAL